MLEGIQKAGGIGGLKKVDRSQIRDRSAALPSGSDTGPHGSGLPPAGVTPGGAPNMADALAAALQKRKQKVGDSGEYLNNFLQNAIAKLTLRQTTKATMTIGKHAAFLKVHHELSLVFEAIRFSMAKLLLQFT
jgi:hypothetical protein